MTKTNETTNLYLHCFKNNGHPSYSMGDVVLSTGSICYLLGNWDGFEFTPAEK